MTHARRAALLLAALLALAAAPALELPPLTAPLLDAAEVLDPAQRSALEQELRALARDTGHRVVVHTTPSLEGLTVDDYADAAAERWGLADGVLLTVAPREQRVRLRVGPELQSRLPPAATSWILQNRILEAFRRRDMPAGIQRGVAELDRALRNGALPTPGGGARERGGWEELGRSVFEPETDPVQRRRRPFESFSLFGWIMIGAGVVAVLAAGGGRLPGSRGRWPHRDAWTSRVVDRDGLFITHHRKIGRGDGTW